MLYNRDLSWLNFNYSLLKKAGSRDVPLFERMKFIAIFYSNMDEFFSIRYPVILAISRLKPKTQHKISDEIPDNFLETIHEQISAQQNDAEHIFTSQILPDLEANDIVLYYNQPLLPEHRIEVRDRFLSNTLAFLQPVFLKGDALKKISPEANKLYMLISLTNDNSGEMQQAIIKVPSDNLKRFYTLAPVGGKEYVIFIDDIIRENAAHIFPGFEVKGIYSIMINRNAELNFEEDYQGDILKKIKKKLAKRAYGLPSRLLHEPDMPTNIQLYVAGMLSLDPYDLFTGGRYHHLADLLYFPKFGKPLVYEEKKPLMLADLSKSGDIFKVIEEKDLLLHFPYQSYNPVLMFFNQAAIDPYVKDIYITLYRIAANSLIASALISAARNGKNVTVFVELKARFDEANNLLWSRRMEKAGIKLIYSIPGIKVHTKIALVIKQHKNEKKAYSLISTGNFNEHTARLYTDHTLLTSDPTVTADLRTLFRFLQKRERPSTQHTLEFKHLYVSQFNMVHQFTTLVENEIKKVKQGQKGCIRIKLNNLEEPGMIHLLYKASIAGVDIRLIVRSICCLVPGIKDLSENIKVKRVVDRYLEHTRLFIFGDGETTVLGSSDWMTRNLYHRIEACAPVNDPDCRKQLLDYFELQWAADTDGVFPVPVSGNVAQQSIYDYLSTRV
jgi:polyphosphate kinase